MVVKCCFFRDSRPETTELPLVGTIYSFLLWIFLSYYNHFAIGKRGQKYYFFRFNRIYRENSTVMPAKFGAYLVQSIPSKSYHLVQFRKSKIYRLVQFGIVIRWKSVFLNESKYGPPANARPCGYGIPFGHPPLPETDQCTMCNVQNGGQDFIKLTDTNPVSPSILKS